MRRLVLNTRGLILLGVLMASTIILICLDSNNIRIFIGSKVLAIIFLIISSVLFKYIPSKYLED